MRPARQALRALSDQCPEPNVDVGSLYRLNGSEESGHGQRVAKVIALLQ